MIRSPALRKRLRRRAAAEEGFALALAVGVMAVLAVAAVSLIDYTSSGARSSSHGEADQTAYALAEAGINYSLSILHNSFAPMTPTLLPSTTVTLEGGTVTYSGTLSGTTWTITSTGSARNPTGGAVSNVKRTLTRLVQVYGLNTGANNSAWSRIYNDDTTACMTIPTGVTIPSSFATRGNLCLNGTAQITGSTTKVAVGGNVTLDTGASIGVVGAQIAQADIAGWCKWSTNPQHQPCVPGDRVYAVTMTQSPTQLTKPGVDFAYWYDNAKPGPKQACTESSGTPPTFDSDTTYNGTNTAQELTPEVVDYTCRVRDGGGNEIGELSWNRTSRILTIKGTIFFDGDAWFHDHDVAAVHYQGRATIYIAGNWHNDEPICAGGTAPSNCRTTGMSSWDPVQNMLVLIIGDKNVAGGNDFDFHRNNSAFQGVIWSKNQCTIKDPSGPYVSGPIICGKVVITGTPTFFTWPPLGALLPGQIYGSTQTSTDFLLVNGNQSG